MENILSLTLFGSVVTFWIVAVIGFIFLILSDIEESGFFAFLTICTFFALNNWWGNIELSELLTFKNAFLYLFTGFLFSLLRTYFKGRELTKREKLDFELKQHVFRWWFLFPICGLNWLFGSLLKQAFDLFYSKIEMLYQKLFKGLDEL